MKQATRWFQGIWKQSILADTLVHLAAQKNKKKIGKNYRSTTTNLPFYYY
jgi:hypothetical protein